MRLNASERSKVWAKSDGHCWYCGDELPARGWHADHMDPVLRTPSRVLRPDNHSIDNIVPACAPCNLYKASYTVEGFRRELEASIERARRTSVNFRNAERFGLISVASRRVVFWFERKDAVPDTLKRPPLPPRAMWDILYARE